MDDLSKYGLTGALVLFAIKEIISVFKNSTRENTRMLQEATLAIVELKVRLEMLSKQLEALPKLTKDIDYAHQAIRQINKDLTN